MRALPVRQSAFGLPSFGRPKSTPEEPKIPIVPKFTEDEQPVKESKVEQAIAARTKSFEDMTEEELKEARALQESEERLAEFERERKANKGKSEQEIQRAGFNDQVAELNKGVEETDNIIYPRDVIGRRFQKEKAKYEVDVYVISKAQLTVDTLRGTMRVSLRFPNIE
jgi:hypothetical protein